MDHGRASLELVSTIQKLSLCRTLEDVIEVTRQSARKLTGADGAAFVLRDHDLCYYVEEDAIAPLWKGKRFPMQSCISGWSMLNRQSAVIEDIYKDARIPADAYRPTFVKSLVMVPIRTVKPIGAIGNYWSKPYKATKEEVQLLELLANSVSIAIENLDLISNLEAANDSLAESLKSRDEFLAILGHELRTPLSSLKLQLNLLGKKLRDTEFLDSIPASIRQTTKMEELIEQLLEVSRIQLNKIELNPTIVPFSTLVQIALEQMSPTLDAAKCALTTDLDSELKGKWDQLRIVQVISILLSNVAKYARGKPAEIRTSRVADNRIRMVVIDHGDGIPKELHSSIFNRFERHVDYMHVSGLGLGLYIAKNFVQAHRGQIWVESEIGKGAKFIVELPMSAS